MDEVLEMEKGFWRGGPDFYEAHTTEGCVMVFAEPVGPLDKAQVIEAISEGPRWAEIKIVEPELTPLRDDVLLLVYLAEARTEDGMSYETMASSLYLREGDGWKLAFHQQSPSGD